MYINFYFRKLKMNGNIVEGVFDAPDSNVKCCFRYNIKTHEYEIGESNKPIAEIIPLPFYWIDKKLNENGVLKETECKISF